MSEVGTSNGPSKSSLKKKIKKEATTTAVTATEPAPPNTGVRHGSEDGAKLNGDSSYESPYIKDLQRNIRNITKKLNATQRVDAIQAENPGVSLDDLVASRKINNDQKTQALKKPSLEAQQAQLEEQIATYKKVELDIQAHAAEEKTRLEAAHQAELDSLRASLQQDAKTQAAVATRSHLLTLSTFLRAAASRRDSEDETSDESKAFEGLLLLLYGGDVTAVDAAEKLVNGSDESVLSTDGVTTNVSYGRVRALAASVAPPPEIDDAPPAEAAETSTHAQPDAKIQTDPTIAHAGLTEQTEEPISAEPEIASGPEQADTGEGASNAAANYDSNAANGGSDPMGDSWVSVPRDPSETEKPTTTTTQNDTSNWTSVDGGQNGYEASAPEATAAVPESASTVAETAAAVADTAANLATAKPDENTSWAEETQDDAEKEELKKAADDGYQPAPVKNRKPRGGAGGEARGGANRGPRGDGRGGGRGRGGERGGSRGGPRGGGQGRGGRGRDA